MKHKPSKIKRIVASVLVSACVLSLTAGINASAVQSSRSVALQNGYTHKLTFNVGKTSGTSTFSISNGGPCSIKNELTAIEYNSSGRFVRNLYSEAATEYSTNRTCNLQRKSNTSDVLKNYIGIGYNYGSTAKKRVSGNTYFHTIEIGDHGIETSIINP